jgi:predicted Zn finger-like uncharacterized protein
MQIRVQCPACKASFEVPAEVVGRDGECSRCRKVFLVAPMSGEIDPAALAGANSNATLEMPVFGDEENRPAPDTDEFDVPELALPATSDDEPQKSSPEVEAGSQAAPAKTTAETQPPDIEDDGSLFGDEIPELEDVPDPISPYASEDIVDPNAGQAYSISGDDSAAEKPKSKKPRRKKPQRKSSSAADGDSRGESSDSSDAGEESSEDSYGDDVQLFDDVLHDKDDEDTESNSSDIVLRRSGTFSAAGNPGASSPAASPGKSARRSEKRSKRAEPVTQEPAGQEPEDFDEPSGDQQPMLKRSKRSHAVADAETLTEPKSRPRKKRRRASLSSPRQLVILVGGGASLLLLAGVYSWLTSGPTVVSPTLQGGGPTSSSGSGPVASQGSDSIETGQTNSSVVRAHRTRSVPGPARKGKGKAAANRVGDSGSDETQDSTTDDVSMPPDGASPDGDAADSDKLASLRPADPSGRGASAEGKGGGPARLDPVSPLASDAELFPVSQVPIPKFPSLGVPRSSTIAGIVYHEIRVGSDRDLSPDAEDDSLPGSQMDMILYLPTGTHEPGSLPCVMIAAAGTTLLEGNGCFDESYQSETIPYVQQGFAVLGYSLDGPLESDDPTNDEMVAAYEQFRAAHAGLVNARNALEFVLQEVPAVNSDQIFTAGHSSAGTLSLLFAEHESRLAGCIAYAPCVDVEKRLVKFTSNPLIRLLMPDVEAFLRQESPLRHLDTLKCPVFVFHSESDSNVPFEESQQLAAKLANQGTSCQFETLSDGDHYDSMLEEGIPRGLVWLKKQL